MRQETNLESAMRNHKNDQYIQVYLGRYIVLQFYALLLGLTGNLLHLQILASEELFSRPFIRKLLQLDANLLVDYRLPMLFRGHLPYEVNFSNPFRLLKDYYYISLQKSQNFRRIYIKGILYSTKDHHRLSLSSTIENYLYDY